MGIRQESGIVVVKEIDRSRYLPAGITGKIGTFLVPSLPKGVNIVSSLSDIKNPRFTPNQQAYIFIRETGQTTYLLGALDEDSPLVNLSDWRELKAGEVYNSPGEYGPSIFTVEAQSGLNPTIPVSWLIRKGWIKDIAVVLVPMSGGDNWSTWSTAEIDGTDAVPVKIILAEPSIASSFLMKATDHTNPEILIKNYKDEIVVINAQAYPKTVKEDGKVGLGFLVEVLEAQDEIDDTDIPWSVGQNLWFGISLSDFPIDTSGVVVKIENGSKAVFDIAGKDLDGSFPVALPLAFARSLVSALKSLDITLENGEGNTHEDFEYVIIDVYDSSGGSPRGLFSYDVSGGSWSIAGSVASLKAYELFNILWATPSIEETRETEGYIDPDGSKYTTTLGFQYVRWPRPLIVEYPLPSWNSAWLNVEGLVFSTFKTGISEDSSPDEVMILHAWTGAFETIWANRLVGGSQIWSSSIFTSDYYGSFPSDGYLSPSWWRNGVANLVKELKNQYMDTSQHSLQYRIIEYTLDNTDFSDPGMYDPFFLLLYPAHDVMETITLLTNNRNDITIGLQLPEDYEEAKNLIRTLPNVYELSYVFSAYPNASDVLSGTFTQLIHATIEDGYYAPAGRHRGVVYLFSADAIPSVYKKQEEMASLHINPIVKHRAGAGNVIPVINGAYTLYLHDSEEISALEYLNVRLYLTHLKKWLITKGLNLMWDPNDRATRDVLVGTISEKLAQDKVHKYVSDFRVSDVSTQDDINQGKVRIQIELVPVPPITSITFNIVIYRAGTEITEQE